MKKVLILASAVLLQLPSIAQAASTLYGDVKLTQLNPKPTETQWLRSENISPKYPLSLVKKRLAGCGVFTMTVNENGQSQDIELVSSFPKDVIVKSAKKIIRELQWTNNATTVHQAEEKLIRIDFCLGEKSIEAAQARCTKQATFECK